MAHQSETGALGFWGSSMLQQEIPNICDTEPASFELPESSPLKADADSKSYPVLTCCSLLLEGTSMEQGFSLLKTNC